jgi:hypothetical protein
VLNRSSFVVDGWFADNIPANAGATTMNRAGWVAEGVGYSTSKWLAPRDGIVAGIFIGISEVLTAGSITIKLFRNGADSGIFVTYPVVTPLFRASYSSKGLSKFTAGDYLELKYTSTVGLTPTTADIMAGLELVLE